MNGLTKALAAEFIGTFALIFLGAGAATALGGGQLPAIALAHGLTIMVFASAFGDISGCHINPAVTVGLAVAKEFPRRHVAPYILAQVAGAVAASYCLLAIFGGPVNHLGATLVDTHRITYGGAFALEAVGTFFLVNTVLHAAVRGAADRLAPFAIGMTVTVCILMFGALTGGSVNPARTIGPAVATGVYDGIAIYLVAQLMGGTIAGVLYRLFWVPGRASAQLETGPVPAE
jgi:MIP family channel proteins